MVWSRGRAAAVVAAGTLSALANAQAFFGGDQSTCAGQDFVDIGCYPTSQIQELSLFQPETFDPLMPGGLTFPGFDPGSIVNNTVTPSRCVRVCRGYGFRTALLQDGNCACGFDTPETFPGGATGSCDLPCSGDASQFCGGDVATQIFVDPSFVDIPTLVTAGNQVADSFEYLGCFNSQGNFPTGNQLVISRQPNMEACLQFCTGRRFPLARADVAPGGGGLNCECGETFAFGDYRVREGEEDPEGACNVDCVDGSAGGCDPDTEFCCGTGDFYPVYINPELEGCYVPAIPGYGLLDDAGLPTAFVCADVPASLTSGPRSLTPNTALYAALPTLTPVAQPIHPVSVIANNVEFFEYGCFEEQADDLFTAGLASPLASPDANTLESCAAACLPLGSSFFGVTGGSTCYCASQANSAAVAVDFGNCNLRCGGDSRRLCGGSNAIAVYAVAGSWANEVAARIQVALATPYPGEECRVSDPIDPAGPTGTGTGTSEPTGTGTGTGEPTGTGTGEPTGTGTGTGEPTGTGTGTGTGEPTGTGTGTGEPTGTGTGTGEPTGTGTGTGEPTGTGTGIGGSTAPGTVEPSGTQTDPTSTGDASSATSSSEPTQPPSSSSYIFNIQIAVDVDSRKRDVVVGANTGFIGGAGPVNTSDCSLATPFVFSNGTLSSGGQLLSTEPGLSYQPFMTDATVGSITTTFAIQDNILVWLNDEFSGGQAGFCQDNQGQVFITFDTTIPPFDCTPVQLVSYEVRACQDGTISSSISSSATATGVATGTEEATATGTGEVSATATGETTATGSEQSSATGTGDATGTGTGEATGTQTGDVTSSTAPSVPTAPAAGQPFIFAVSRRDNATLARRHSMNTKRQLQVGAGFVGAAGPVNPTDCSLATPFTFLNGQLSSGGELISTDENISLQPFFTNPTVGAITTTFSLQDSVLVWANAAFDGGVAGFCQDTAGQVWITFDATPVPFDCAPVDLIAFPTTQCADGTLITAPATPAPTAAPTPCSSGACLANGTLTLAPGTFFNDAVAATARPVAECYVRNETWVFGETTLLPRTLV